MERDLGLMEALSYLDAHMTSTGHPDWEATNPDTMGEWEADSVTDYAAEAIGKKQKANEGDAMAPYKRWSVRRAEG